MLDAFKSWCSKYRVALYYGVAVTVGMFLYFRYYGAMFAFKRVAHGVKYSVNAPSLGLFDKHLPTSEVQQPQIEVDGKMVDNPKFPVFDAWRTKVGDNAVARRVSENTEISKGVQKWKDDKAAQEAYDNRSFLNYFDPAPEPLRTKLAPYILSQIPEGTDLKTLNLERKDIENFVRDDATKDDILNGYIKKQQKEIDEYNAGWTPTLKAAKYAGAMGALAAGAMGALTRPRRSNTGKGKWEVVEGVVDASKPGKLYYRHTSRGETKWAYPNEIGSTSPASTLPGPPGAPQPHPVQGAAALEPEPQEPEPVLRTSEPQSQKPEAAEKSAGISAFGIFLIFLVSVAVLAGVVYAIFCKGKNEVWDAVPDDLEAQES